MAIPAETLSGGKLSKFGGHKEVRQYRVWVHPKRGDGFYFPYSPAEVKKRGGFAKLVEAARKLRDSGKYMMVEPPLAVVWDKKYNKYREVVIDIKG